jgi:hypothetical protein
MVSESTLDSLMFLRGVNNAMVVLPVYWLDIVFVYFYSTRI